jgi:predicted dehydrogenase
MTNNQKIRFAVIGCGHIGKRHASIIQAHTDCSLVALCDGKAKEDLELTSYADTLFFNSLDDLLAADLNLDVAVIASPNGYHEAQAIKILEKNCHVVIEKPMALTKTSCERIIFKALQKQKHVFCVMQNRYSTPSVWLKDLVEKGVLGKIFMVQTNCYWNRDDRYYKKDDWHGTKNLDGGTLFTQFSHFIDLLYWCFGDITNIQAKLNNFAHKHNTDFEDSGFVNFDFVDGGVGSLNYSTAVWQKNLESSITIIAENGTVKVGGQYMDEVIYCHIKDYEMPDLSLKNTTHSFGNYKSAAANHHFIYDNIVDVLTQKGSISTNALEGLKVVDIIERIYQA